MALTNADKTCRLCLVENDCLRTLFGSDGLLQRVEFLLQISLINNPNLSQYICQGCDEFLDRVLDYKETVIRNQSELLSKFQGNSVKIEFEDIDQEDQSTFAIDSSLKTEIIDPDKIKTEDITVPQMKRKSVLKRTRAKSKSTKVLRLPKVRKNVTEKKKLIGDNEIPNGLKEQENFIATFTTINCGSCSLGGFKHFDDVKTHNKDIHSIINIKLATFRCGICNKKYNTKDGLFKHIMLHKYPDRFKCEECGKSYPSGYYLKRHQKSHMDRNLFPFECPVCKRRFHLEKNLNNHIISKHTPHEERRFPCPHCDKRFNFVAHLRNHIVECHTDNPGYVCEFCAKIFGTTFKLKAHVQHVHGEKPQKVQCEHCLSMLGGQRSLREHIIKMHTERGNYPCDQCSHVSPNQRALSGHIRRNHTKVTFKHVCHFCEKAFRLPKLLREHVATHTGEKLHTCRFCPQDFVSYANMCKHHREKHPVELAEWRIKRKEGLI